MFRRGSAGVRVWLFDLLALNGRNLRGQPLAERKRSLAKLLPGVEVGLAEALGQLRRVKAATWREANRDRGRLFEGKA
jgi:ATP-dependent DNA ligase